MLPAASQHCTGQYDTVRRLVSARAPKDSLLLVRCKGERMRYRKAYRGP